MDDGLFQSQGSRVLTTMNKFNSNHSLNCPDLFKTARKNQIATQLFKIRRLNDVIVALYDERLF